MINDSMTKLDTRTAADPKMEPDQGPFSTSTRKSPHPRNKGQYNGFFIVVPTDTKACKKKDCMTLSFYALSPTQHQANMSRMKSMTRRGKPKLPVCRCTMRITSRDNEGLFFFNCICYYSQLGAGLNSQVCRSLEEMKDVSKLKRHPNVVRYGYAVQLKKNTMKKQYRKFAMKIFIDME